MTVARPLGLALLALALTGCDAVELDTRTFLAANRWSFAPFLDPLMLVLTRGWIITPIAAAGFLATAARRRSWRVLAVALPTALLIVSVDGVGHFIKRQFERPRPCHVLQETRLLVDCLDSGSFPSNHAANAFAAATLVIAVGGRRLWPLWIVAALVSYSRVHVGVHYPSDIVAGALLGTALGGGAGWASRRTSRAFAREDAGRAEPIS